MSRHPAQEGAPSRAVLRILLLQAVAGVVCAALAWPFAGLEAATHFLLGTLVGVIPNAYLGMRIAGLGEAADAQSLLRAAWLGEVGKLALTILLLGAVFAVLQPTRPGWVLGGFIAVQFSSWLALFVFRRD
ncbi:MAG: F0F1 ATP synthase subunit I [Gammaproteobacteria bacterium]|nr:F0F1 ATP synthase subunit I [Gammaproteobacteria bacterium]